MADLDPVAVEADTFANQLVSELSWLLRILRRDPPASVLELGVAFGGSLWAWAQVATPDAKLMGIDVGLPGNGFDETLARYPWPARPGQTLNLLQADSGIPESVGAAREYFGGPVDFMFIDADHSRDAVVRDFELYSPLVKPGGLVGFHDVANQARDGWQVVSAGRRVETCVDPDNQGAGIGVIFL